MKVFHGTGAYALEAIREQIQTRSRSYIDGRAAFCVTTSFGVAELFGIRRSSAGDWPNITGVVIEFDLCGAEGVAYSPVRDPRSLQEEEEIAIFDPSCLEIRCVYHWQSGQWTPKP